jgi:hypothetical protein
MTNGDPRVFGSPYHFPAAPSIRSEVSAQDIDNALFFGLVILRKNFTLSFPKRQGKGGAVLPCPLSSLRAGSAIEAPSSCGRPRPARAAQLAPVSAQEPEARLPAAVFADTAWNGVLVLSTSDKSEEAAMVFRLEEGLVGSWNEKLRTTLGGSQIPLSIRCQVNSVPLPTPVSFLGTAQITFCLDCIFLANDGRFRGRTEKFP